MAKKNGPGRRAKGPSELPARSWRDVLRRTWVAMSEKNMAVIAAGIAFYEVWAFFPALVALVILGGIFFGEGAVVRLLSWIRIDLPESFDVVVVGQLKAIAQQSRGIFSLTLVGALLFSFWSAMRGVRGLIQALNVVYGEDEERPFWRRQLLAFWLSCFCGGLLLIAISLIVSLPPYAARRGEEISFIVLAPSRWPFLILLLMISLSVIYRYGPCPARGEVALGYLGRYHKCHRHRRGIVLVFLLRIPVRAFQSAAGIVGGDHGLPLLVVSQRPCNPIRSADQCRAGAQAALNIANKRCREQETSDDAVNRHARR